MAACRGIERLGFVPHQLSGRERPRLLSVRKVIQRMNDPLEARRESVMAAPGFWAGLPPLPLGRERLQRLRDAGFVVYVVRARGSVVRPGPTSSPGVDSICPAAQSW